MAVKVFVSYSHVDDELRHQLEKHLAQLRREGHVAAWTDRRIPPGNAWGKAIDDALEASEVVLLLVSPDFLASEYCNDVELKRSLARHRDGTAKVIPVIVRPCDWGTTEFAKLQALPRDGKPVTRWEDRDEAWLDVVRGLRKVVTRPRAAATVEPTSAGEPELSVFLAAATDDLDSQRGKLAKQLAAQGVTVREAPRAATRTAHAAAVAGLLRRSDLAVHLLGPLAGRAAFDDGPESLPLLELELGLEHADAQLVLLDKELSVEDVEAQHYAALLERLQRAERAGLERVVSRKTTMPDVVTERVAELLAARRVAWAEPEETAAFVDVHTSDLGQVGDLLRHLVARRLRPLPIEPADLTPPAQMARFEDYLRQARVCFVVFGAVERQRVVDRLVEANKLIWAKGFATRLVGYLAPPVKRGEDAAFANLAVVDASHGFNGAAVDRVLAGLAL